MSSSVFATPGELPASFNRWDIPVKVGVFIGVLSIILSVISYMFILPVNYIAFLVSTAIVFIVMIILYGVTGARQRRAMGGYISLKDAFSAIFVAILISTLISTIWGVVYAKWIDPHVTEKMKESTLAFMEHMKVPQDKLDATAAGMDNQLAESTHVSVLLYNYAKSLVFMSIFGFICAAIVKRTPKQQMM